MEKNKKFSKFEKGVLIISLIGMIFTIFMAYNSLNGYPYIDLKLSMNILAGTFCVLFLAMITVSIRSIYDSIKYNRKSSAFRRNLKEGDVAKFGGDVVNVLEINGDEATIVFNISKNRLYPLN